MGAISVRLPDSLHKLAKDVSSEDKISLNQFIASAVAEKISALTTEKYLAERAARGSVIKFKRALSKVPKVEPIPGDELV
jgi:hypothetical protein